jgi:hypothetical protein
MKGQLKMKTQFKNSIKNFAPIFLVLVTMFLFGFGCKTPDPLAAWTFKPYQNLNSHNNHLEQVIVDDYEGFIKQNSLDVVSEIYGLHEDGKGQYAVDFDVGAGHDVIHYILFYDKDGKRIKVEKYLAGHVSC